jgi:hypothetical protein
MNEGVLNKIAIITLDINNIGSRNLLIFEKAFLTLSGDYLIITDLKDDNSTESKVINLSSVYSYKIYNNNKEK